MVSPASQKQQQQQQKKTNKRKTSPCKLYTSLRLVNSNHGNVMHDECGRHVPKPNQ